MKRALVEFAQGPRFAPALEHALKKDAQARHRRDEGAIVNVLDHFILQQRLADGQTVVEHFVAAHPALSEAERALLLGWQDVVEGIFAAQRRAGAALIVVNLIDDLTYQVHSNMGPRTFRQTPVGSFLIGRLVPIGDEWLISGNVSVLPAADRAEVYRLAAEIAQQHPALVFCNPQKLAQAWDLQREERASFIAFFGSDLIVIPGHELAARLRAYGHFRLYEVRDAAGQSAADRAQQTYGVVPPVPEVDLPDELYAAETVGLLYDEVDGLNFLTDFGLVAEAFAQPERTAKRRYRQTVRAYLEDPSISPRLVRRLAEQDPQRASQVVQRVLKLPHFSWEQEGEALLHRYKASYFAHPVLPSITPVSETLARAQLAL